MSTVTWPADLKRLSFSIKLEINQRSYASPYGGSEQVVDLLNDRWLISITMQPARRDAASQLESFINSLRGMTNTVALWHMARPTIAGTLSSATAQATAQGAAQILLNATTGQTLKAGDMIGIGGLLLQVADDCTSSGSVLTVPLVNRLRKAISAGAAVTLTKPTANFRLMTKGAAPQYLGGYAEGVSLDFAEVIA